MSANPTWLKTLLQLHDCIFAHLTCIWLTKLTSAVRLNYSTCKRSAVECMCIYIDLRLNWRESFRLVPICQQHLVIYCSQDPGAAVMCSEHTQIGTNCGNDWVRLQGIVGKIELLHHRAINFIDCHRWWCSYKNTFVTDNCLHACKVELTATFQACKGG